MINKISPTIADALAGTPDGATVLIGGFGTAGIPSELIDGLIEQGARDLTLVNNNAGNGTAGIGRLIGEGRVSKVICSFPTGKGCFVFKEWYEWDTFGYGERELQAGREVKVVTDQTSNPTLADSLAEMCLALADSENEPEPSLAG